ncbi:unnamed protein product [Urochloa decumbens]|uniref:Uncharacterized protein n=1 Tax=Urochloa decumbens TaxID=240449 RepID=A0ABC9AS44_9POAL
MHDLVHDLARLIMDHGIIDGSKHGTVAESGSRYALLTDCSKALESYTSTPENIKALLFVHYGKIDARGRTFSSSKSLQVLDLSGCSIEELPGCIGELVQLRYLKAQNIESGMIPDCFSNLSELIYLNISGSGILALPESIGALTDLMYLDISDCTLLGWLPASFKNLKRLVHLDLSNSWCQFDISEVLLLGGLTNLEYLNLSLDGSHLSHLTFLQIKIGTALYGVRDIIDSITDNLIELRYLGLSNALHQTDGYWGPFKFSLLEKICTLSNLEHLDLSHNYAIVRVPDNIGSLKKLHTLDLSGCRQLTGLPECILEMDSLKVLNVTGCSELKYQPAAPASQSQTFTFLPHFQVRAQVDGSSSDIAVLRHADPEELHISSLDNVKSAEEARSIKLTQKQGMGSLALEWTIGAGRSVEDMELLAALVPPRKLKKFRIKGYNSSCFPEWVMDIALYLPDITKIELCDVPEIIFLPPLGQLPNLKELVMEGLDSITTIGDSFCGGARAFPQLTKFRICNMINLEEWNTVYLCGKSGVKKFMFPKLQHLSICYCLKLRLKPCPPKARIWEIENSVHVLSSLRYGRKTTSIASSSAASATAAAAAAITQLRIIRCTDMTYLSPKIIPNLSSIKSLWLEDIIALDKIPEWLGSFVALQELVITRCTDMGLRNLKHLTSLRLLSLKECPSITSLPEWPESCLKELVISDCTGITYLPRSILTNLKRLYIYYCPELAYWCKENMKQFHHIEDKKSF